jgi:hypothetical protein
MNGRAIRGQTSRSIVTKLNDADAVKGTAPPLVWLTATVIWSPVARLNTPVTDALGFNSAILVAIVIVVKLDSYFNGVEKRKSRAFDLAFFSLLKLLIRTELLKAHAYFNFIDFLTPFRSKSYRCI